MDLPFGNALEREIATKDVESGLSLWHIYYLMIVLHLTSFTCYLLSSSLDRLMTTLPMKDLQLTLGCTSFNRPNHLNFGLPLYLFPSSSPSIIAFFRPSDRII